MKSAESPTASATPPGVSRSNILQEISDAVARIAEKRRPP
jgi:hypothetical protein